MGINPGDLTVMKAAGYLFVSFHGDTGGMATADVLRTVHRVHLDEYKECKVIMGIDANSYSESVADGKKKYSVKALQELIGELSMKSCFGGEIPQKHTTNCPRTYLQPQLNKAVKREDIGAEKVDFRAPKDWLLSYGKEMEFANNTLCIDNTGKKQYKADPLYVIPSQHFPSDHAILSAELNIK